MAIAPKLVARPARSLAARFGARPVPLAVASRVNRRTSGIFPYSWDSSYPARVGLLPREGDADDVRWFDVEPCYVFHPLNAFDDGDDRVVLDVVRHPKMFDTHKLGPDEGAPTLDRWTVDLAAGKVLEERLDDRGQEFPRVDARRTGRRHRYGYSVGLGAANDFDATLVRHDFGAGRSELRNFGPHTAAGEFVFVPAD